MQNLVEHCFMVHNANGENTFISGPTLQQKALLLLFFLKKVNILLQPAAGCLIVESKPTKRACYGEKLSANNDFVNSFHEKVVRPQLLSRTDI